MIISTASATICIHKYNYPVSNNCCRALRMTQLAMMHAFSCIAAVIVKATRDCEGRIACTVRSIVVMQIATFSLACRCLIELKEIYHELQK